MRGSTGLLDRRSAARETLLCPICRIRLFPLWSMVEKSYQILGESREPPEEDVTKKDGRSGVSRSLDGEKW